MAWQCPRAEKRHRPDGNSLRRSGAAERLVGCPPKGQCPRLYGRVAISLGNVVRRWPTGGLQSETKTGDGEATAGVQRQRPYLGRGTAWNSPDHTLPLAKD